MSVWNWLTGTPLTPKDALELLQYGSVIVASIAAIYGIGSWYREFIGKRRVELAEEVLALFYQAKDVIAEIRAPFSSGGEGQTRKPGPNETLQEKQSLDSAFVLIERYRRHSELFSRIQALRYRFMVTFGKHAAAPFQGLVGVVNELIISAQEMYEIVQSGNQYHPPEKEETWNKYVTSVRKVYYATGKDDPIQPKVDKVIEDLETICRRIIEKRGKLGN